MGRAGRRRKGVRRGPRSVAGSAMWEDCGRILLRIGAIGECGEPVSFCTALARSLGKMTQAVDIMFTTGPRNRGVGALWGVRAAGAKGCAAARAL